MDEQGASGRQITVLFLLNLLVKQSYLDDFFVITLLNLNLASPL